jgi:AmiR/NasT family two-component response regulator
MVPNFVLQICSLLTPYNLAAVKRSLRGTRATLFQIDHLSHAVDPDVVVIDTEFAQIPPVRGSLPEFVARNPHVGIALVGRLTRDFAADVAIAAHAGVSAVILSDFDAPQSMLGNLRDAYLRALPHRLVWSLQDELAQLPDRTADAVRAALTGHLPAKKVADVATFAGITQRTAYRHLDSAGFVEAKALHRVARLLRRLRDIYRPGTRLELVAAKGEWHSYDQFQRHVRALTGMSPRELRYRTDPTMVLGLLARALVPAWQDKQTAGRVAASRHLPIASAG